MGARGGSRQASLVQVHIPEHAGAREEDVVNVAVFRVLVAKLVVQHLHRAQWGISEQAYRFGHATVPESKRSYEQLSCSKALWLTTATHECTW